MEQDTDVVNLVKSLELAGAQIEMSMQDSADAVSQVLESVLEIAGHLSEIDLRLNEGAIFNNENDRKQVASASAESINLINNVVMAMQFYDRLSQRLEHVEHNLGAVADLIQEPGKDHDILWENLQKKLKAVYSTKQEQRLMALVQAQGGSAESVAEVFESQAASSSDTEFF